jgi:predicted dehydrogenase
VGFEMSRKIRFGILGAARIAPSAIVWPARERSDVEVVAIAARDRERARAFAAEHGIHSVESGYAAVVERPDIDVVYVPLPASLHHEWCERALMNGKHVLCEKPMTTSVADAIELVALAADRDLLLAEAFHYRYHPLMARLCEIVSRDEVGTPSSIEAIVAGPAFERGEGLPREAAVYWDTRLGGGATLQNACYAVHCIRSLLGTEGEVVHASATWFEPPGADAEIEAELAFPGGIRAKVRASLIASRRQVSVHVMASEGEVHCDNFVAPHAQGPGVSYGSIAVSTTAGQHREVFSTRPTYSYQLDAFVDAITQGEKLAPTGADVINNARTTQAILEHAAATTPRR